MMSFEYMYMLLPELMRTRNHQLTWILALSLKHVDSSSRQEQVDGEPTYSLVSLKAVLSPTFVVTVTHTSKGNEAEKPF